MVTLQNLGRAAVHMANPRSYAEWAVAFKSEHAPHSDKQHALAAAEWLLRSQNGGYAAGYSLFTGWQAPFPETTGYIIPTLLDASRRFKRPAYRKSALAAGEWLLAQQQANGSFLDLDRNQRVFDTGQIIFGLLRLYKETKDERYLEAATRAGTWIVRQQERNGAWIKGTYQHAARTYYSRVSWALLELWLATDDISFKRSAQKQLAWVLEQEDDGWFRNAGFFDDERPVLHTIIYTIRGLWESSRILKDKRIAVVAVRAAGALDHALQRDGTLYSYYTAGWRPASSDLCLTGLCQAGVLLDAIGRERYKRAVARLKSELKSHHNISTRFTNLQGGVAGSAPITGSYMRATYPNWAAKFLLDLMMR